MYNKSTVSVASNTMCTVQVKLKGLPGDRLCLVKEVQLVKVIQFGSSLLMIRKIPGLFLRLPITYCLCAQSAPGWMDIELVDREAAGRKICLPDPKWLFHPYVLLSLPLNSILTIHDHKFSTLAQSEIKQWTNNCDDKPLYLPQFFSGCKRHFCISRSKKPFMLYHSIGSKTRKNHH